MNTTRDPELSRRWLWILVACLGAYWLLRLPNLLALPVHTDEGEYVIWAQWMWGERPLYFLESGKVLTIALNALFNPFNQGLFIARYLILLTGAVGMVAAYATARKLHSPQAGILCVLLWLGTPGLIFYERMNLHDVPLAAMSVLTLWLTLRMLESRRWQRAAWAGVGLLLCVAAKGTGLIFLSLPILVLFFPPRRPAISFRRRVRQTSIAYAVFIAAMIVPVAYLISVRADPLYLGANRPASLTTLFNLHTLLTRIQTNVILMIQAEGTYLTPYLLVLLFIGTLVLIRHNARLAILLLLITAIVFMAVAALASKMWLRYVTSAAPYLLLLASCGLAYVVTTPKLRRWHTVTWVSVVGFIAVIGLPYAVTAQRSPADLPMPITDRFEYVKWVASGYGIREATIYLRETITEPTQVFDSAGNCYGAKTLLSGSLLTLECPVSQTWWDDTNEAYVQRIHDYAATYGYALIIADETAPIIAADRLPQPLRVLRTFPRPDGEFNVLLYCAGSRENGCPSE